MKNQKLSLRYKAILLIILFGVLLGFVSIGISAVVINRLINNNYRRRAENISSTLAVTIDPGKVETLKNNVLRIYESCDEKVLSSEWGSDAFNAYIAKFSSIEQTPEYQELLTFIRSEQDVNDVNCLYLWWLDQKQEVFLYLIDGSYDDQVPVGVIDPLYDINRYLLDNPDSKMTPYITNTEEYGWLVTAAMPIHSQKDGSLLAYATVDLSMNAIKAEVRRYLFLLLGSFIVLTVILIIIYSRVMDGMLIKPIKLLSDTATRYYRNKDLTGIHHAFSELEIKTGDEIEELSESLKHMEFDMNNNILNLLHVTNELNTTKDQVQQMNKLAYKDGLTGVKNRLAYDQKMEELSKKAKNGYRSFGMAVIDLNDLKHINDTYGHERGNLSILAIAKKICTTFAHSPVFRIGGDEFAVILENSDFENRDKLIQQFEASLKEPEENPWEQITAAIGYVTYHEGESMEQFFDRADQNMYQRKQQMKKTEQ
ncbi:MAG: GGDEF domain-containing protein [Solobacterium sp.]|nr:GGDEF domain-containing protein [Solobacterium sp.]